MVNGEHVENVGGDTPTHPDRLGHQDCTDAGMPMTLARVDVLDEHVSTRV